MNKPTPKQVAKAMQRDDLVIDLVAEPKENGKGATVTLNKQDGTTVDVFNFRSRGNGNGFIDKVLVYFHT